jgi:hypothetical protein
MAWTIKPMGSWGAATSSAPGTDFPAALALPGTWHWFPGPTTLAVRKDQWGSLAAAPGVDSVTPGTGGVAGGTVVTIAGEGLTGSTGVTFGGTAGTAFSVVNDATVRVTTPAHAAGAVAVVVANPRGNVTVANGFTYA